MPQEDYPAIRQNAVLLKTGEANDAAKAFLDYLKSDEAIAVIKAAGYSWSSGDMRSGGSRFRGKDWWCRRLQRSVTNGISLRNRFRRSC